MNALAGDEIQRCETKIIRGWDRAGGTITLEIFLMYLQPGAIFLTIKQWVTVQGARVILTNVYSRYNKYFPLRHHLRHKT
jgi:hypothetical protein